MQAFQAIARVLQKLIKFCQEVLFCSFLQAIGRPVLFSRSDKSFGEFCVVSNHVETCVRVIRGFPTELVLLLQYFNIDDECTFDSV